MPSTRAIDSSSSNALLGTAATVSPFKPPSQEATDVAAIPGLRPLWAETLGDPRLCVAILDGPIDRSHPSFAGAELSELRTRVTGGTTRGLATKHGTHIASLIFGQHDGPIKGVAPRCRGLIVPIFRDSEGGSFTECSQHDLALAITQAARAGAHIINISGGVLTPNDAAKADPLLTNTVRYCAANGVLVVAAAGNEGCDCLHTPGALPSVLAVGAMSAQGLPLDSSNWGEKYQGQGVLAPGEDILGAVPSGGISAGTGTSYATPIVSGVAALLLSLQLKQGQKPDPQRVREVILRSALGCDSKRAVDCRRLLVGRLNVGEAMSQIMYEAAAMSKSIESKQNARVSVRSDMNRETTNVRSHTNGVQAASATRSGEDAEETVAQPMMPAVTGEDFGRSYGMNQYTNELVSFGAAACGDNHPVFDGQPVFTYGQLGYDVVSPARLDSLQQSMMWARMKAGKVWDECWPEKKKKPDDAQPDPNYHRDLWCYLNFEPNSADQVSWTLLDPKGTPIYAIVPQGAFAMETFKWLRLRFKEQVDGTTERVSVAGHIAGSVSLDSGHTVPIISPVLRGMYDWTTDEVVDRVLSTKNGETGEHLTQFLNYLYEEQHNRGTMPAHRALNYAATNAKAFAEVFERAQELGLQLESLDVEPSGCASQDKDLWDIRLLFNEERMRFRAKSRPFTTAPHFVFTVGVGDVVPATIGSVRSPFVRRPTPGQTAPAQSAESSQT